MMDEPETTRGYLYTHWDCPGCGSSHEAEGDRSGDTLKCDDCGEPVRIGAVL